MTDPASGNPHRLIEGRSLFEVTERPLSVDDLVHAVLTSGDGAVVTFVGTVRDNNDGRSVVALEYEAYAGMAEAEMERIGVEMISKHSLHNIAMRHRTGKLPVGETSVIIAASSPTVPRPSRRAARRSICSRQQCRSGRKSTSKTAKYGWGRARARTGRRCWSSPSNVRWGSSPGLDR